MHKTDLCKWKDSVDYGQRLIVETLFSCIKGMFGKYVTAIRFENILKEIILKLCITDFKVWLLNNYQL